MRSSYDKVRTGLTPQSQPVHLWCTPVTSLAQLPKGKELWQTTRLGFNIIAMGDSVGQLKDKPSDAAFSVGTPAYPLTENGHLTGYGEATCTLMRIPHTVEALFRLMKDKTPEDLEYKAQPVISPLEFAIAV